MMSTDDDTNVQENKNLGRKDTLLDYLTTLQWFIKVVQPISKDY